MRATVQRQQHDAVWMANWLMRYNNDHEAAFQEILAELADGRSFVEYCSDNCVRYSFLVGWIRDDTSRSMRFDRALIERRQRDKERAREAMIKTVEADPEGPPTHSERLKAASMLMGDDDEKKSGGVTINIVRFSDEPVQVPNGYTIDVNAT